MRANRWWWRTCAVGWLLASAVQTSAQNRNAERLAASKSLTCEFPLLAAGTWTKLGMTQADVKPATLKIGFNEVDVDDGTAVVVGPFGASDIIVRLSSGTLHLVQSYREGGLYVTTVFPSETREGKLKAAHSRHEYTEVSLPGFTSRPEQYYGECAITK